MKTQILIGLKFLLVMTILTGLIYPFFMTGLAQIVFPTKANGSLISNNGKMIGSELLGQKFDSTIYFWSRPSAIDYNPIPSGASNYGPTSDKLKKQMGAYRTSFGKGNNVADTLSIPLEMISQSGSGLDPHISPEAAQLQFDRIVKARKLNDMQKQQLQQLIRTKSEDLQYFIFGEQRLNVLELNLALDKIKK